MPRTRNKELKFISTGTTPENHALIVQAAKISRQTLGDFMATANIAAAKAVLAAQDIPVPVPIVPDQIDQLLAALEVLLRQKK